MQGKTAIGPVRCTIPPTFPPVTPYLPISFSAVHLNTISKTAANDGEVTSRYAIEIRESMTVTRGPDARAACKTRQFTSPNHYLGPFALAFRPRAPIARPYLRRLTSNNKNPFSRDNVFDLSGKVALVPGGGSGIGLMVARTLATNGAKVYISGRSEDKLDHVVSIYNKPSLAGEIIALPSDVRNKEGVHVLHKAFCDREQYLDILVNNAGVSSRLEKLAEELFDGSSREDWNKTFNSNVTAQYFVVTAFLPQLRKPVDKQQGFSSTVLFITSMSGLIKNLQGNAAYSASKAATLHLSRMLSAKLASTYNEFPIRVNGIAPGFFRSVTTTSSGIGGDYGSGIWTDDLKLKVPVGRPGRDEDMAQAVLFCVACQYWNGQYLTIDGGYSL